MKTINNNLKTLLACFLLFFVSTTYYSCKKSEKIYSPLEALKSDARFINVLQQNMSIVERVSQRKEAIALMNKPNPSISDLEKFSVILGFSNFKEYSEFAKQQNEILLQLKEEYQLTKVDQGTIESIALESMKSVKQAQKMNSIAKVSSITKLNGVNNTIQIEDANNCERIRRNCLITVAATATAAHVACIAADLTVIVGAVCHGAAIAYQLAAGDNCNANAENCRTVVSAE